MFENTTNYCMLNILLIADIVSKIISLVIFVCLAISGPLSAARYQRPVDWLSTVCVGQ